MNKRKTKSAVHRVDEDTMREEYDFSKAVRGVTAARYAEGTNVELIDPDLADIFPDAKAVNEALRTLPVSPGVKLSRTSAKHPIQNDNPIAVEE